ncbi:MAG TPA: hypothetical protein VN281_01465, partial [Verrucomicrobiae bacterium]|nr:hypothetical protein [Verrucomicrobiae bacterium]
MTKIRTIKSHPASLYGRLIRLGSPRVRHGVDLSSVSSWFRLASGPLLAFLLVSTGLSQAAFVDFNTVGQYTNNFHPWNDNGTGGDAGNYAFTEGTTVGVGGSGGVSIFQSTDTTATYKSGSWNFATNGATVFVSMMVQANGLTGNRAQIGIANSATNGFNANSNVAFETFRLQPSSATVWAMFEQYRTGNANTTSPSLGNASVTSGHWYKFLVS